MRKTYIDNIRWITVVLVVIYHVIFMFNGVQTFAVIGAFREVQYQDAYLYLVYPWFMLLLFVVSGMSSRFYLENHSDKEFVKSRTVKLLVPSTIGLFVFQWILGYYSMAISGAFDTLGEEVPGFVRYLIMALSGQGVLWYVQLLWVFSIALVLIRKIEKDRFYKICEKTNILVLLLLTAAVYFAAQVGNTPLIVVYRFGIYGLGFLLGYFVFSHDAVMERLEKYWHVLGVAAVALAIAFTACFWGENYADHVVLDTLLCNVFAWFGVLGVLSLMKKWGNFTNGFSAWMIKKSWGLYVFHYLALSVPAYYLHVYAPELSPVIVYLVVGVSAFAGAFLLNEIISRIPVVRWCVLGIKGKKNTKAR